MILITVIDILKQAAEVAVNSKTGRPMPDKILKKLERDEEERQVSLEKIRLKNIQYASEQCI